MPESNATIARHESPASKQALPSDAPEFGGLLVEVQSLVYWWLIPPEEACEIVDFPIDRYRPRAENVKQPDYMPSPAEIDRLCRKIRTGQLVVGGQQGKLYLDDSDGWADDEDVPNEWPDVS